MRQFDVHELAQGGGPRYIVVLQADVIRNINVVVAAPLYRLEDGPSPTRHLHPVVEVLGERLIMMTNHIAAAPPGVFGPCVASLTDHRDEIIAALDFLFTGI